MDETGFDNREQRKPGHVGDCGKVCYPSAKAAKVAIVKAEWRGTAHGKMHSYFCEACRRWHIGHRGEM